MRMRAKLWILALAMTFATGSLAQESKSPVVQMQVPEEYSDIVADLVKTLEAHPRAADFPASEARGCSWDWDCDNPSSTEGFPSCSLNCRLEQ
jgi:hypothetical protein